jgi:hypothetical protein
LGGLGGGRGGLGADLPRTLNRPLGAVQRNLDRDLGALNQAASDLVGRPAASLRLLGHDDHGAPVIRDEVIAVSPTEAGLSAAQQLGFEVVERDQLDALSLSSAVLRTPSGMDPVQAVTTLRQADPAGSYDFAHIYNPSGEMATGNAVPTTAEPTVKGAAVRIGMIDGPVEKRHSALSSTDITTARFAGKSDPAGSPHGTAIASLLVGKDGDFVGYLPGARLFAADVYGGDGNGGTASDIARALNWMAANRIAVTNISLAGPSNALLEAAVKAFVEKGYVLVAAVGNDGPAAPPNYPAAYPGVIAVTSVDAGGHIQMDANSGGRYAALGVNVRAAALPRGFRQVTGTSYASPSVAAHLATLVDSPDPANIQDAASRLTTSAVRLEEGGGKAIFLVR